MSTTKPDDVTAESKKRARVEDETDLPVEKQPKRNEGESPSSVSPSSTPEPVTTKGDGESAPTLSNELLEFVVEEAKSAGAPERKVTVLRFNVKAEDIALKKRFAKDNEALYDPRGDSVTGWRKNAYFIFSPQDEPYEPAEDAPAATSAHPVEQAWMTKHGIKVGDVWHETGKLCDVKCVFILLRRYLAIQVAVADGEGPFTLNMLIQAVEQALNTPADHPLVRGTFEEDDYEDKPITLGHLLEDSVLLVTENLTSGAPPSKTDVVVFAREGTEAPYELEISSM